jgi:hypothetical protein
MQRFAEEGWLIARHSWEGAGAAAEKEKKAGGGSAIEGALPTVKLG